MAKRRTVIEELHEEEQILLVSGGEDFQTCLNLFLRDMTTLYVRIDVVPSLRGIVN